MFHIRQEHLRGQSQTHDPVDQTNVVFYILCVVKKYLYCL